MADVLRNVVLHINGEQPLLADLYEVPSNSDVGVRCTNLRMMNGKRPIFVDDSASVFFFAYLHIRFIEIPPAAAAAAGLEVLLPSGVVAQSGSAEEGSAEAGPEPSVASDGELDDGLDGELEIDEDFLRRIREI
jgi:hypothetical protein